MALVSVSDDKIQITILILRRGALSKSDTLNYPTLGRYNMYDDDHGDHIGVGPPWLSSESDGLAPTSAST